MNNTSCVLAGSILFRFCTGLSVTVAPLALIINIIIAYATWKIRHKLQINLFVLVTNVTIGMIIFCTNSFGQAFYLFILSFIDPCAIRMTYIECRKFQFIQTFVGLQFTFMLPAIAVERYRNLSNNCLRHMFF